MLVPIRLGTKRKMFSFVCSSSTVMGCFGVPLLWLETRLSAAMLAEGESSLVECDVRARGVRRLMPRSLSLVRVVVRVLQSRSQ